MSPSKIVRRTGIVATGTFMLAMAASPAYAIGGLNPPAPPVGTACFAGVTLPSTLQCLNGVIQLVPLPTSAPTTSPASPSPSPNPLTGVTAPLTGTVNKLGQTIGGLTNGAGKAVGGVTGGVLPSLPAAPSTPANPVTGTATTPVTGATGGKSGSTSGSKSGKGKTAKPMSDGSSLLGPAAAFLPGSAVATFADLGSSSLAPLADNIPLPLLASPEAKLAAVQAPLIAAGDRASSQADSVFSRFAGKALPGILVVLATAMVAAVGAGNLRAWQARIAAKRAQASA